MGIVTQLAHICIGSHDLKAAEHFYCDILEMERGFDFVKDDVLFGFYVKAGANTFIEIFSDDAEMHTERVLLKHLCLQVDDLDAAIKTIRAKGWDITDKKQGGDQSWQAWLSDPSGVSIELMQYTAESSQFTGNPCIVDW